MSEIHYRVSWRPASQRPGEHRGLHRGAGYDFNRFVPLLAAADPRRLDLRASIADPLEQLWVREYTQRSAIDVAMLIDVSASMGVTNESGVRTKMHAIADFIVATARATRRVGDELGVIAADEQLQDALSLPFRQAGARSGWLAQRLRLFVPTGRSTAALAIAHTRLPRRRALVFLVSDFHAPIAFWDTVLASLARHELIPVVLWDAAEIDDLPRFGLVALHDPESGAERWALLREASRRAIERAFAQRRDALRELFDRHRLIPIVLTHGFDADRITARFYGQSPLQSGS